MVRTANGDLHVRGNRADAQECETGAHFCLTREAPSAWLVPKDVEDVELLVFRREKLLASFEHVDSARAATRAPARERYRRVLLVAEVDDRAAVGDVHGERRTVERFDDEARH